MKTHSLTLSLGLMFISLLTHSTSVFAGDSHSREITLPSNEKLIETQTTSPATTLQIVSITPYTFNGGVNIRCWGQNTGQATVHVSGGTAPYSYVWLGLPYQTSDVASGLYAGTYTVIVTDAAGASVSDSVTLIQNSPVKAIATASPVPCNGGVSIVSLSASGGTAPFSGLNSYDVVPGTYYFTVADANGCRDRDTVTVTEPAILDIIVTPTPIMCFGDISQVTVSGTGGTLPYTGVGVFNEVAGTHTYHITDANGCLDNTTLSINEPGPLMSAAVSTTINCFGETADVTVTVVSGVEPYSGVGVFLEYAGAYEYVVVDKNGCIDTASINISQPDELVISISETPITCNGGSSNVSVTATGGMAPYTGTGTFSVIAGTYTYTVVDANGCTSNTTVTITEPAQLVASISSTDVDCNIGTSDVTVTATGGIAPYTGIGTFTELPGTYTYTITDNSGCLVEVSTIIAEPATVVASSSATSILCNGGSSDVTVSATGGTTPYIGTGSFSEIAGSYTYTVIDANECISSTTVIITEPAQLSTSVSTTSILCNGGFSDVTVEAIGGKAPYTGTGTFSESAGTNTYSVTDANGCSSGSLITISEPEQLAVSISATTINCSSGSSEVTVEATGGVAPYVGTGTFFEPVGTYSYSITDANGCVIVDSITVVESPQLNVAVSSTEIACFGGSSDITVTASGGVAPYMGTGAFSETAGTYTYMVTDASGCSSSETISIVEPTLMTVHASCPYILCSGGTADVAVFAFGGTAPYLGTDMFTVTAGTYDYAVIDANGCTSYVTVVVEEPNPIQANVSPQNQTIDCIPTPLPINVNPTGGLAPYSYAWSNESTSSSITANPNVTTTYDVIITDANGCTANAGTTVTVLNRCGKKNNKVVICHVPTGNPNNPQTICISQDALNTHLASAWNLHEGDYCGPCNLTPIGDGSSSSLILAQDTDFGNNSFIRAAINTRTDLVELSYRLTYDSQVRVEIYDLAGSLVEVIHENNADEGELYDMFVSPSKFTSGVYIYQFITDKETHIDKMQFVK